MGVLGVDADTSSKPPQVSHGDPAMWAETLRVARALSQPRAKLLGDSETTAEPFVRSSSATQFSHKLQSWCDTAKTSPPRMPQKWRCKVKPDDTQVVVNVRRPKRLLRFRLLVLVQGSGNELKDLEETVKKHGDLALTWSVLGVRRCIALPRKLVEQPDSGPLVTALATQHIY